MEAAGQSAIYHSMFITNLPHLQIDRYCRACCKLAEYFYYTLVWIRTF